MGPISYDINVAQPFETALQGLQIGDALRQRSLQQQQLQLQQQQQLQMRADLEGLAAKPNATGADYAAVMTRYPQLSEQLKRSFETLNTEQQASTLSHASQVYAALKAGRGDVAKSLLIDRATALENSGDKQKAQFARTMAEQVDTDPQSALTGIGTYLGAIPGGDKVIDGVAKLGTEKRAEDQAPGALRKVNADAAAAEADATSKAATAKYADQTALLDLQKKGWDITAVQSDIEYKKQTLRIEAMKAAIAKEDNALKRQELKLKIDDAVEKRDQKLRDQTADAESGAASIDNMLNTIERLKKNPRLNDVVGSIEGRVPAMLSDESANAVALIETLGSQAFMAQIPAIKGTGALSDAEGKKLQSALQNLSRTQGEEQFRENLEEAARLVTKARNSLSKRYGVPLGAPDTPAAKQKTIVVDW